MMKVQAQAAESVLAFGDVNDIVQLAIKKHPDSVEDKVEVLKKQYANGVLKFSDKEINKMPKWFRKQFILNGCVVQVRKRIRGRSSCSFELRYRRDGYNVSVSATTIEQAKARFIEKLFSLNNGEPEDTVPKTFHSFATYYFETFRKRKVAERTFATDMSRYLTHIKPHFEEMPLKAVTSKHCQDLLDSLRERGFGKTADEVYSLMNIIFKMAIKHDKLARNPLDIVIHEKHVKTSGTALTAQEEAYLLSESAGTPFQKMFAVALYTGLRPNEFKTARIEGDFIIAQNSKRKNKKIEMKVIPISPMLKPYLDGELLFYVENRIREKFKTILPNHILYDLRTTFYSRCKECGVAQPAIDEFMGHSLGALGNAYTALSREFLYDEAQKIRY